MRAAKSEAKTGIPPKREPDSRSEVQNSRHGEKIHAIATGRGHHCSGRAGLHRRRSTACRLTYRVVNADAGIQFIAPSSQNLSHVSLHLERQGGAKTVARQQPWSNSAPPMSGVLASGRNGSSSLGATVSPSANGTVRTSSSGPTRSVTRVSHRSSVGTTSHAWRLAVRVTGSGARRPRQPSAAWRS